MPPGYPVKGRTSFHHRPHEICGNVEETTEPGGEHGRASETQEDQGHEAPVLQPASEEKVQVEKNGGDLHDQEPTCEIGIVAIVCNHGTEEQKSDVVHYVVPTTQTVHTTDDHVGRNVCQEDEGSVRQPSLRFDPLCSVHLNRGCRKLDVRGSGHQQHGVREGQVRDQHGVGDRLHVPRKVESALFAFEAGGQMPI